MTPESLLGARARYLRVFLDLDAATFGARVGLSALAVLRAEAAGPTDPHLQALLDLRVDALERGACCALAEWTVEEMREAAEADARAWSESPPRLARVSA